MIHPIEAFKNPISRPRALIWLLTALTFLCMFVAVAVMATTSYWFCASICHKVQDDSITAYQNSTHSKVSCVSCHMPVGADPVTFLLHKVEALAELPPTLANTFELPLNPYSEVAMSGYTMPSAICLQCHIGGDRFVTPSRGIIMDHDVHAGRHISCTVCHNRVGHNEDVQPPQLIDPISGEVSKGHVNYMKMDACYRCHRLEDDGLEDLPTPFKASGACPICHTDDFDLVPSSHKVTDFIAVHGKLAVEADDAVREAEKEFEAYEAAAHEVEHTDEESEAVANVPNGVLINTCYTCHKKSFCTDCHGGVEMPHPQGFLENHREAAQSHMEACETCHGGAQACTMCHHTPPNVEGFTYDTSKPWLAQHWVPTQSDGAAQCFNCHEPTFCANCHVRGTGTVTQ
jgi:hypothetical protein